MSYLSRQMWAGGSIKVGGVSTVSNWSGPVGDMDLTSEMWRICRVARGVTWWTQRVGPSGS